MIVKYAGFVKSLKTEKVPQLYQNFIGGMRVVIVLFEVSPHPLSKIPTNVFFHKFL
jgi:hypothetical protein